MNIKFILVYIFSIFHKVKGVYYIKQIEQEFNRPLLAQTMQPTSLIPTPVTVALQATEL